MHVVSMMHDCIVSTVLVVHIFDFLALLFSVMTIIKWHKLRLTLLSFCTSDSSFAISHDYSMHPWTVSECRLIVFCVFQIAAGRSFPQKTKQNRHGDIKFLDELAQNKSEFVQVTSRPSQLTIQCDCDTRGFPWQAVLHPTSGAVTAALAEKTEQLCTTCNIICTWASCLVQVLCTA